jgi:hypothetical protein
MRSAAPPAQPADDAPDCRRGGVASGPPPRSPGSLGSTGELLVTRRQYDLRDEREVGDAAAAWLRSCARQESYAG